MHDLSFQRLRELLHSMQEGELLEIQRAFDFALQAHAHQTREDGSPYALHVIAVAETLACWHADRDTIIAALLHDVLEDTSIAREEIATHFGRRVVLLVESVTKFSQADLSPDLPLDRKVETLRKLFDVMRHDMRSILIKLADRLHNVCTIDALQDPARRRRFARETLDVYHKIALHLGMRNIRHVFAEHCVPAAYDDGLAALAERDRGEEDARPIAAQVMRDLAQNDTGVRIVRVDVQPRNLLTFYERRAAGSGIVLPSDAFIISVQVPTEDDCYRALRLLHTLYRPVSNQFRDYIAAPSDAGYQSLHTMVTLPDGRAAEMRIRTAEMEEQAMQGITLWLFRGQRVPPNFAWLHRSEELDLRTRESSSAFWEALQSDVLSETISVTVDRRRLSIPKGSTILDAAYAVHGPRAGFIRSANIGISQQPLSFILSEDDDVHCTFDAREQVTFDWLQMVSTQHARMCVIEVLKTTSRADKQSLGAGLLQKELDHYGHGLLADLSRHQCQNVARHFRRSHFQDVLALIGEGVLRSRDVVFFLYPDRRDSARAPGVERRRYRFRLRVAATAQPGQEILSLLQGVVRMSDVVPQQISTRLRHRSGIVDITIIGSADDRLAYADFVDLLERQEWVSQLQTMISRPQKICLIASAILALVVLIFDIVLFPSFYAFSQQQTFLPDLVVQALPLLPILAVNYYLLRLLRHSIVRMRSERWFLGLGLLLNIIGLLLIVLRMVFLGVGQGSLLPLVLVFTASLLTMGYRFFQADLLFHSYEVHQERRVRRKLSREEISRKIVGYVIRIAAVMIWGIIPIYIRYTPIATLPPILRLFLMGLGVVVPFSLLYVMSSVVRHRRWPSFCLTYDWSFWTLVAGQVIYLYLENLALLYTSGTNLLLFNNFAPVIGLFVAALLWRHRIPYLRHPRTMVWLFFLAALSGLGSGTLIYSHAATDDSVHHILGDALALLSTFFDVLLTIGQIEYLRYRSKTSGLLLTLHLSFYCLLVSAPIFLSSLLFGWLILPPLSPMLLLLGAGLGTCFGVGMLLNFEAFKRIDGYIAYMLFNLSVVVTFVFEVFIVRTMGVTLQLVMSATIILLSAMIAEYINSLCQTNATSDAGS